MKILVIVGNHKENSFNHGIARMAVETLQANGHDVIYHDLYAEQFDPVLYVDEEKQTDKTDPVIKKHCQELKEADGIIVVHPNWWGQPPAIVKGWIDRVICQGLAYEFGTNDKGEGVPIGLLKAKTALVFNTANTPMDRELEAFGDPLENLWKNCIFDFCGVKNFVRRVYTVVVISTAEERKAWLEDVQKTVEQSFP